MKIERGLPLAPKQDPNESLKKQDENLRAAANLYEQHFMREMVKAMRQTVNEGGLVETSFGEKIFREQLDQQYVEKWSGRGGVGLADMIYNHVKERYFPNPESRLPRPQGPLPLQAPGQKEPWHGLPLKGPDSTLDFQSSEALKSSSREVLSPWAGRVTKVFALPDGTNRVEIQHDVGLVSCLTFKGTLEQLHEGRELKSGERMGRVRGDNPWLRWQISSTGPQNLVG